MKNRQQKDAQNSRKLVYRVIYAQLMVTLLIAVIVGVSRDTQSAYSAIVAGLICAVANWVFTWRVLRYQGARAAKKFVVAFLVGETAKLVLLGVLFVLSVLYLNIVLGPFLLSFIINLMIYWFAPFIIFGFGQQ